MRTVNQMLSEWQDAKVVTPAAAKKIADYEAARVPIAGEEPTRKSALAEVLGYLGAALAIVAIAVILGQQWDSFTYAGRLLLVFTITGIVAGAGIKLWRSRSVAIQRLVSVLLTAAVFGVGWLAWLIERGDVGNRHVESDWVGVAIGGAALAAALPIYWLRRRALAQFTLLGTAIILVSSVLAGPLDVRYEVIIFALWAIGVAWFWGGWSQRLEPPTHALVVGTVLSLFVLLVAFDGDWEVWILSLGVLTAVALSALAVQQRGTVAVMAPGAIGMLIFVPLLINYFFDDDLATWVAVLVTGLALVVAAVFVVRERKPRG